MGFVKLQKNKAYFKTFAVKYRRRRQGKTDYRARRKLTIQAKNKYNSPKYRLVVRFSNRDIVCQVIYATIKGDIVMAAAYAHELPKFGITLGLTNYSAAYATGLLLSRRLLTKLKLADAYQGVDKADGEMFHIEDADEGPRPFMALLDVGLVRTTTGHRVFGAMKGAVDGGLRVPHSEKRFPGYNSDDSSFEPEELKKRIMGGHVADYMRYLEEQDEERFKAQFSRYIKAGVKADDLEAIYAKAHAAIRKNPVYKKTDKSKINKKRRFPKRLTYDERKARVAKKLEIIRGQKE